MIDLHILHAISNGIKAYQGNQAAFEGLFPELGQNLRTKYWNKFSVADVSFTKGFSRKIEKTPAISVAYEEASSMNEQLLSNGGRNKQLFLSLESRIKICDKDYDLTRILHRVIQSVLLLFKNGFLQNGYLNFDFVSSEALENDEGYTSSDEIYYARELTYNAQRILEVQPFSDEVEVFWQLNLNIPFDYNDADSVVENVLAVPSSE